MTFSRSSCFKPATFLAANCNLSRNGSTFCSPARKPVHINRIKFGKPNKFVCSYPSATSFNLSDMEGSGQAAGIWRQPGIATNLARSLAMASLEPISFHAFPLHPFIIAS